MAIEKYTTPAIIITSFDQGEHDRVYKLFTRDFGLVMATAKSVRKLESKLRAHILPRTQSTVTLVQGKDMWRLVGAESRDEKSELIHEATGLISRFIHGEEAHTGLYDRVEEFLNTSEHYDKESVRMLLYYVVLVELGYADVKVIGAQHMKEYRAWSIDDLYTHLLLSQNALKSHVRTVLKDMQL